MDFIIKRLRKIDRIDLVCMILIFGFGISIFLNYILGINSSYGYPFNTFLYRPTELSSDFVFPYAIAKNPYNSQILGTVNILEVLFIPKIVQSDIWNLSSSGPLYFPFAYWIGLLFRVFPPAIGLIIFWGIGIGFFISAFITLIRQHIVSPLQGILLILLSYPFLFALDRANFELIVFVFLYIFVFFYNRSPWLSRIALACAIAMKLLPAVFLLLYLSDKKYKDLIITLGMAFLVNLAGYALYPGGFEKNIIAHLLNLRISSLFYSVRGQDIAFNHSLLAGLKFLFLTFSSRPDLDVVNFQANSFMRWISPILAITMSIWVIWIEKEQWKKVAIVTCLFLLIPAGSADYRLLHLYIPFFLWLGTAGSSRFDKMYALIFGLLFIPKNFSHLLVLPEANISVVLNPLLMIVLMLLIMGESITDPNWRIVVEDTSNKLKTLRSKNRRLLFPAILGISIIISAFFIFSAIKTEYNQITDSSIIPSLKTAILEAEKQLQWRDVKSYYYQWILADPANPLPRLRLAEIQTSQTEYKDAYRQYQKVLWLPSISQEIKDEAEAGLQLTLRNVVRSMIFLHQYKQASLFIQDYEKLFPYLPRELLLNCELSFQWALNYGEMFECFSGLQGKYPYQVKDFISRLGYSKSQDVAMMWINYPQSSSKPAYQMLGWSYLLNGDEAKAIDAFKQVLQIEPDKSSFQGLSMSYLRASNIEGLCNTLRLWKLLDPMAPTTLKVEVSCLDVK